jgi:nucleotide-binding universal stress UspA family protein
VRVLCCLDGTNLEAMRHGLALLNKGESAEIGFIHVIDLRPREELKFRRGPHPFGRPGMREREIPETESTAAEETLDMAVQAVPGAKTILREGRPEREIVNAAAEWRADLVLLCPRIDYGERPRIGPKSIGHIARFVVDHAPCPVLLLRPFAREAFPIER